jgi:hypothetical protein
VDRGDQVVSGIVGIGIVSQKNAFAALGDQAQAGFIEAAEGLRRLLPAKEGESGDGGGRHVPVFGQSGNFFREASHKKIRFPLFFHVEFFNDFHHYLPLFILHDLFLPGKLSFLTLHF